MSYELRVQIHKLRVHLMQTRTFEFQLVLLSFQLVTRNSCLTISHANYEVDFNFCILIFLI